MVLDYGWAIHWAIGRPTIGYESNMAWRDDPWRTLVDGGSVKAHAMQQERHVFWKILNFNWSLVSYLLQNHSFAQIRTSPRKIDRNPRKLATKSTKYAQILEVCQKSAKLSNVFAKSLRKECEMYEKQVGK